MSKSRRQEKLKELAQKTPIEQGVDVNFGEKKPPLENKAQIKYCSFGNNRNEEQLHKCCDQVRRIRQLDAVLTLVATTYYCKKSVNPNCQRQDWVRHKTEFPNHHRKR
jgi:hypothetical protein